MLIFIGVTWVLVAFGLLIPKSERFERFSAPFIEKIMPARQAPEQPDLLPFESLEPGSRGEEVLALQRYLKDTGYLRGLVDGIYGPGTQNALSAFQKANGLEATGNADKETIQTINRLAAEAAREAEQQNKE
jgi:peptidoglycan hydrolase-like protein with peptidoglycan-binding domain